MREVTAQGGQVIAIGPPQPPHLAGLRHIGIDERRFVWIQADRPAERLWVTEQVIRAGTGGAIVSWLPHARPEQLRRLQIASQSGDGLIVVCCSQAAQREASAAPLHVLATLDLDWALQVRILKRRGPLHDAPITLPSIPGGPSAIVTPRVSHPSRLFNRNAGHVVGSPARESRRVTAV